MARVTGYKVTAEDWNDFAEPQYVTALPASPDDGEQVYFQAAAGVIWHLRYNAASASSFKWEYVGGPPLTHEVATSQSTTSATYADLATVGPQVTLPLAGDYDVQFGTTVQINPSTGNRVANIAVKRGAAATADADSLNYANGNLTIRVPGLARAIRMTGLAAAAVLKMQYKVSGDTLVCQDRWMRVTPVRVG